MRIEVICSIVLVLGALVLAAAALSPRQPSLEDEALKERWRESLCIGPGDVELPARCRR